MDTKDQILQELCPTIMVPRFSELPELSRGRRYLMDKHGLWIEARQEWGHFRFPLWESPVPMPYGMVYEIFDMERIPDHLIYECIKLAQVKAVDRKEWAGWITWDSIMGYEYMPLDITCESTERVEFNHPKLSDGTYMVMDIHSHPFDMPHFSTTDDHDDIGGVYIAGVISFNADFEPVLTKRLCVEGYFFNREGRTWENIISLRV